MYPSVSDLGCVHHQTPLVGHRRLLLTLCKHIRIERFYSLLQKIYRVRRVLRQTLLSYFHNGTISIREILFHWLPVENAVGTSETSFFGGNLFFIKISVFGQLKFPIQYSMAGFRAFLYMYLKNSKFI